MMQMQHNAAALAQNKAENFHLRNVAAGLFLCQFMQGPAEIGHCAKHRLQNFWISDNRSGIPQEIHLLEEVSC